jgi:cell division protein FtsX
MLSITVIPADQLTTTLLAMFLCLGVGIGIIGSAISIRRFLDV